MAGLGWTGTSPYGLQATLRQQVLDRLSQEQQGFQNDVTTRELALREQQAQAQEADRQAQIAERTQAATDAAAGRAGSTLSIGQSIPPQIAGRLRGSMLGASVQDNPDLVQPPSSALGGEAMTQPDIQPGSQPGAVWQGTDAQRTDLEQKQSEAALANDPNTTPQMKMFLRARQALPKGENIPYQMITEPNGPTKAPPRLVPTVQNGRTVYTPESEAAGLPVPDKPDKPEKDHYQLQPELDATGKQTGKYFSFNTDRNRWETVQGEGPGATKAAPGAAQNNRQQTLAGYANEDIDSALKQVEGAEKAGLLGPVNGRVVGQFLGGVVGSTGNPQTDNQLGALRGAIQTLNTSYGPAITGSPRGAGAANKLKTVLDTDKFSADSLRGALGEMKAATGRRSTDATPAAGSVHMKAPDGRDLNVPATEVERLKGLGATVVK